VIDSTIEEFSSESSEDETKTTLIGARRSAIDSVFRHNEVESIFADLVQLTSHEDESVKTWASSTVHQLNERSPTSLKVSLAAIRRGKKLELREALNLELNVAAAFCVRFSRFAPDT
jgi:3-hydroxyisobutyryl-CoA hydrolase